MGTPSRSQLEFGNVGFLRRGETVVPGEKPLRARTRTNKLNPHMTPRLGIEPRPHWWEASALTIAPSLPPLPPLFNSTMSQTINFDLSFQTVMTITFHKTSLVVPNPLSLKSDQHLISHIILPIDQEYSLGE